MDDLHTAHADQLIDGKAAARYLDVAEKTLRALRVDGGGPAFYRIGRGRGRIRYRIGDLRDYVAGRRRVSTTDDGGAA